MLFAATMTYYVIVTVLMIALAEGVLRAGSIELNRIVGAASTYVALGLVWELNLFVIANTASGHVPIWRSSNHRWNGSDLIYFNNIKLTTLG